VQDNADSLGGFGGDRLDGLIDGLVQHGYAIAPGYFPLALVRALREEAQHRDQQGEFQLAGIGRRQVHQKDTRVRSDRTCWLRAETLAQCQLLEGLESGEFRPGTAAPEPYQPVLFAKEHPLVTELRQMDVSTMTPLEAINTLYEMQRRIKEE
jgi:hypothetical protein